MVPACAVEASAADDVVNDERDRVICHWLGVRYRLLLWWLVEQAQLLEAVAGCLGSGAHGWSFHSQFSLFSLHISRGVFAGREGRE
jgi:hypothetical protein